MVFKEFDYLKCLVSFADSTFGHSGTIYKASNWTQLHETKKSYHYISPEGRVVNKKSLYDLASKSSIKERVYANSFGYKKVLVKKKIKFVLYK